MEEEEISKRFVNFLRDRYYTKLLESVKNDEASLNIDFQILDEYDSQLTENLLYKPVDTIRTFEDSIKEIDVPLSEFLSAVVKQQMRLRFFNLPEFSVIPIRNLRAQHIGQFVSVEGTVRRASEILPAIVETTWLCPKCRNKTVLAQQEDVMKRPVMCDCGYQGKFDLVEKKLIDTRWITVEEPFELTEGERPSQLNIFLREDLTSLKMRTKTDPGNRLKITGVLKEVSQSTKSGKRSVKLGTMLEANHVESTEVGFDEFQITPEEEQKIVELSRDPEIYEKLIGSIAPSTYGLREIKEALAMQLFSGVPHVLKDEIRIRGDIHILITGDPSTGKSQILKLVARIANRGKYVSGKGVSVDYDDPIIYRENGTIKTELIGKICDRFYDKNQDGFVGVGGLEVPAFDPTTLKISWKPISYVYRHEYDEPIYKLNLRTGREVRVTFSHSVFTVEDNKVIPKKVEDVKVGDFILIPSFIPANDNPVREFDLWEELKNKTENLSFNDNFVKLKFSPQRVKRKIPANGDLLRLIGYYIADGSLSEIKGEHWTVKFDIDARDKKTIDDIKNTVFSLFGLETRVYKKKGCNGVAMEISNKLLFLFFRDVLKVGVSAETKKVPDIVFNVDPVLQSEFIKGFVIGDYGVTISKFLISDLLYLFLFNGVVASFSRRRINKQVKFPGHTSFVDREIYELKSPKIKKIIEGSLKNSGLHTFVPLDLFSLSRIKNLKKSKYTRISDSAKKLLFSPYNDLVFQRLKIIGDGADSKSLSEMCSIGRKAAQWYLNSLERKGLTTKHAKNGKSVFRLSDAGRKTLEEINFAKFLMTSDFGFVEVVGIEKINSTGKFVYDVSVENCENFVAGFGGVMCHNTGVGLTASVVKDEQFMGGWVLEAGAVVLCNKGLCSIDEFEKMHKDDQIALHEAMEQQSYHYQTPVTFSDGTVKPIGEFVEDLMKSYPERIISGNNCLLLPTESLDIKVFSTDFNKIKEAKITRISKHTAPKHFVRIKSQNGREVMVTPEHPIFVIRNGKVECASADSIKTGEFLPIPRILPLKGKIQNFDVIESEIRTNKYNSKRITIPTHNSPELFRFLGYMESEGCSEVNRCVRNGIIFTNTDERLIGDFKKSVKSVFGVDNFYVQRRDGKATLVRVVNKELANFINMTEPSLFQGCEHKKLPNFAMKAELSDIKHLIEALFNGDGFYTDHKKGGARIGYSSNSKQLVFQIQELLLRFGIRSSIYYQKTDVGNDTYKLSITGIENLVKFDENFNLLRERKERLRKYVKKQFQRTVVGVIPHVGNKVIEILKTLKLPQEAVAGYTLTYHAEKINFSRRKLQHIVESVENEMESLGKIRPVLNKKMTIDKLKEIRHRLGASHSDVAKKIGVCHQSISYWELNDTNENNLERFRNGLLSIIEERMIIKTDLENLRTLAFGEVDWCNVIEIERIPNNGEEWVYDITVEPSQNFISNYMVLHNSVSVAKATIVASLPAKTSILAAANPKLGRFDLMKSIHDQIDIPETLLSRFDLKFALMDIPNVEADTKMAEHILKSMEPTYEKAIPVIDPKLLRKYVAYARKNCLPTMPEEVGEMIKKFYLDMRNKSMGRGTISITARQFEALRRLSEASAKVRLSPVVTTEDANRAIRLLQFSLQQLGLDRETGLIDIDRAEGGISSSQRNKIRIIIDIIDGLTREIGKVMSLDDIISAAEQEGMSASDTIDVIDNLKRDGQIIEPKFRHIQKV